MFNYNKNKMTTEQVTKLFTDLLESLILSGQEFDEHELRTCWQHALDEVKRNN